MDEYNKEKNKENLEHAIEICMNYGYNLSLQLHKYIGVK
jgi:organic radical activating enzyme